MANYSLTRKAAADLEEIYEYTILNFGLEQAQDYLLSLHNHFGNLAENPLLGRSAAQLAPNLRRLDYESHVIFFVPKVNGALIVRVLHASMDAARHFS